MRLFIFPLASLFIVTAIAPVGFGPGIAEAETIGVDAGSDWFCSEAFEGGDCVTEITAGDTVTWTIVENVHTVTECDASHTNCGNGFDSGILEEGATFSQTFDTSGSYPYYCGLHPDDMRGTVVVQAATQAPTAAPTSSTGVANTTAPTTAQSPGSVPSTGGPPVDGGFSFTLVALLGGLALLTSGGVAVAAARRR